MTDQEKGQLETAVKRAVQDVWDLASSDVLDELVSFGQLLMNEVQQRSGQLDTKLTTMLGLSGAMAAFLLIGNEFWSANAGVHALHGLFWYRCASGLAAVLCIACIVFCYLGLRLRKWEFPSESDWIKRELLTSADEMKRFHIISMLETRNSHNRTNAQKALQARIAERILALASVVVASTLLARIILQLTT